MRTITSTISEKLGAHYEDFEDTFGIGPCGAFAALKREQGWGKVAVCIAGDQHGEFPHYVIVDDGVIDLANPLGTELSYTNIEILDTDEMPEAVTDEMVSWLRARGI